MKKVIAAALIAVVAGSAAMAGSYDNKAALDAAIDRACQKHITDKMMANDPVGILLTITTGGVGSPGLFLQATETGAKCEKAMKMHRADVNTNRGWWVKPKGFAKKKFEVHWSDVRYEYDNTIEQREDGTWY